MKHRFKNRVLSLVLSVCMMMPIMTQAMPVYSVDDEVETLGAFTTPFTEDTPIYIGASTEPVYSKSYRIPSMVTLNDGTIVAAADIRWNTTYDGGGLDTLVARSTDGGASWDYTLANYLGDNGNAYNAQSTTFIDPSLLVGADGQTVYMLVDLYAGGIALNGKWDGNYSLFSYPSADIGFDDKGRLLLSSNSRASYDFYLNGTEIRDIATDTAVEGFTVDDHFNISYTDPDGTVHTSNLFFADSPYKVAQTGYLYLIKSTDKGETWSAPTLLNLKRDNEWVCLVGPGHGVTTSKGVMVFPVYGYYSTDPNTQEMGFIYSTDNGASWKRSDPFTAPQSSDSKFSSEATVVELNDGKGTLRFFYRNDSAELKYADCSYVTTADGSEKWVWSAEQPTGVKINSDTQLSAISYSKKVDGKQVILVSCPTGPNCNGSSDNNGSNRINGKVFVFVVENSGSMTLMNSINLFDEASDTLPKVDGQDIFDENTTFFAYSSLTERADGSVALLYENSQHGWGATDDKTYFTITGKAFSEFDLIGGLEIEEGVREKVLVDADVTEVMLYNVTETGEVVSYGTTIPASELDDVYYITDSYYDTTTHTLLYKVECCVGAAWPEGYEEYRYVPAAVLDKTEQGLAYGIENFTNVVPLRTKIEIPQPVATYNLRSRINTFGLTKAAGDSAEGIELSKTIAPTPGMDGYYTITLEAYATGTVTKTSVEKPMDIVLVLDQSGSMKFCIGCGDDNENVSDNEYHTVYKDDLTSNGVYYRNKNGNRVYHCETCNNWHPSDTHTTNAGETYTPKTSAYSSGTQFYEKCESRLSALKTAVTMFVNSVYEKAAGPDKEHGTADDVPHRVAIVGFASGSSYSYENTELLSISNSYGGVGKTYSTSGYNRLTEADYRNVLKSLDAEHYADSKTILDKAIEALAASGATCANLGMKMAEEIYKNNVVDLDERNRVTIMFTDGSPTSSNGFETNTANSAISSANTQKNTYKAAVYTIGVFDGARASEAMPTSYTSSPNLENRFMYLVSSNYPSATAMNNTGTVNPNFKLGESSYYLSASNATALNEIFQKMSDSISAETTELGAAATIKDIVAPNFVLPEGTDADDIRISTMDAKYDTSGNLSWATTTIQNFTPTIVVNPTTKNVSVNGFDFKHNFVSEFGRDENSTDIKNPEEGTFHGRKLIIQFEIKPDPYFLGGSNVPTNAEQSGIYEDFNAQKPIATFEVPNVDVPLKEISTVVQDKNIYVSNSTDLTGLLNLYVKRDDLNQNLQVTVDGINNAYVNLEYTITLDNGVVDKYTIPAGKEWDEGYWESSGENFSTYYTEVDKQFSVTCVMSDKAVESPLKPPSVDATGTAKINVFYPVVTFKDVREKVPNESKVAYSTENYVSVIWKDNAGNAANNMEGTAPTLSYTYVPDANCVNDASGLITSYEDFHVNVTSVKGNGQELIGYVTFAHTNANTGCTDLCGFKSSEGEFMIHMKKVLTSLTIQKSGWLDVDPNQSFLFRVTDVDDPSVELDLTVTVVGNGSTTITGLRVGKTYQVVELTDWSWRYTNKGVDSAYTTANVTTTVVANGAEVTLVADDAQNVITFANERTKQYWLDGDSYCRNYWGNLTPTPATQNTVQ